MTLVLDSPKLRKLTRPQLQSLAKRESLRAVGKNEDIIRRLVQKHPKGVPALVDANNPSASSAPPIRPVPESREVTDTKDNIHLISGSKYPKGVPALEDTNNPSETRVSAPRSTPPARKIPTALPYDEALFSGTESEMTEEEQLDFATPVSSRGETPPPANLNDLKRCVKIMQEISSQDVALLNEAKGVREAAAKLRKRARDIRDLVKAESWRRERMEAYFRYWQETEPAWDRKWLYGENVPDDYSAGPSTIPDGQPRAEQLHTPVPGRKPMLSPEEVKKRREAIIAKQEAEQRELKGLRQREMRGRSSSEEGSNRADDGCNLGGANLPLTEENDNIDRTLMISLGNAGALTIPVPSP